MLKECPYTALSRDALENTPPSALKISLGREFCNPRPSRLPWGAKSPPLGNIEGRGGCIFQCIPTRGSVRIHNFSLYLESLFLDWMIKIEEFCCRPLGLHFKYSNVFLWCSRAWNAIWRLLLKIESKFRLWNYFQSFIKLNINHWSCLSFISFFVKWLRTSAGKFL